MYFLIFINSSLNFLNFVEKTGLDRAHNLFKKYISLCQSKISETVMIYFNLSQTINEINSLSNKIGLNSKHLTCV